jgi:hypothetical protein
VTKSKRRKSHSAPIGDAMFGAKAKKPKTIPFDFVLDELSDCDPITRPMFGAYAVYVADKLVLILRERDSYTGDNGVWLATTADRHAALRPDFPNMRSIKVFGPGETGWQVLSPESSDFETSVVHACELIRRGDSRIGKIPGAKSKPIAKPAVKPAVKRVVKPAAKKGTTKRR